MAKRTVYDPPPKTPIVLNRHPPGDIPSGLFYRCVLMDRVGLNESELRSLERRGVFRSAAMTTNQRALYNDETVSVVNRYLDERRLKGEGRAFERAHNELSDLSYKDEEALAVFEGLEGGMQPVEIVLKKRIDPRLVDLIVKRYEGMTGARWISAKTIAKITALLPSLYRGREDGVTTIKNEDDFFDAFRDAVKILDRVCPRCRENQRSDECEACIIVAAVKRAQAQQEALESPAKAGPDQEAASLPGPASAAE